MYVAIIYSDSRYWLMMGFADGGWHVHGWHTEEEARKYFADTYDHSNRFNGVNSTAITHMFFTPYIVQLRDDEHLRSIVVAEPKAVTLSNFSGRFTGVEVRPDMADALTVNAYRPSVFESEVLGES